MTSVLILLISPGCVWGTNGMFSHHSSFSGLTSTVGIGRNAQRLRVALDFNSHMSTIFTGDGCRPFIQTCFNPRQSLSFERFSTGTGCNDCADAKDMLLLDGVLYPSFPFKLLSAQEPTAVRSLEVSGYISMVPSSPLVSDQVLIVASDETGVSFRDANNKDFEGSVQIAVNPSPGWDFTAILFVLGTADMGGLPFRFDPSAINLELPLSLKNAIMDLLRTRLRLHQIRRDSFLVDRSAAESSEEIVLFSMVLPSGEALSISLRDLLYPPDFVDAHSVTVENTLFCPIRLRFSGNTCVVLGRPFLHAQTEVVLDAKSSSIYVFPRIGSDTVEPFIEPTPLLPTFSDPQILPDTVRFPPQTTA